MNRLWVLLALSISVVGCNNKIFDNDIKKSVRAVLKDPDSAIFENEIVVETRACISVNAKNTYGGYTGKTVAYLKQIYVGSSWHIETLDGEYCDESILRKKIEEDKVIEKKNERAEKALLEKLKSKKIVEANLQSIYEIKDEVCKQFASDLMSAIRIANEERDLERKQSWEIEASQKMAKIDEGSCK